MRLSGEPAFPDLNDDDTWKRFKDFILFLKSNVYLVRIQCTTKALALHVSPCLLSVCKWHAQRAYVRACSFDPSRAC